MGIKDLWSILTPFFERKPLFELQGKTVAIDLSCWICEAQNVTEYSIQPRMYLRNLYFRTCYLLLMDVQPVFVLEGKAPELKFQTIANRNEIQFKGAKPKSDKIKTGKDRTRFHFVLKQCAEMLKFMGLACIQGKGEAESMCAYLNEDGLVAGCISQDSDCFAYGAQVVYRNFSISHQGSYAASGGAVDIYNIQKANDSLNFGRNKIVALALLCGSDYNDGVHGVGKDSALKFMNKYKDDEILDRMRSWRKNASLFQEMDKKISDKNICSSCGHFGKIQAHTKSGCAQCNTKKGCDFTKFREERLEIKNELQIRNKALADPNFPNESLINEYLIRKDDVKQLDLKWRQPNLINFVKFTVKYLGWEEIYAFEKLFPILTRWQIKNYEFVFDKIKRKSISNIKGAVFPKYIKKARNPKGIPSYEIIWEDTEKYFDFLIPEEQIKEYLENNKNGLESLWSTIEPKYLVDEAYPDLVDEFLEKKAKKGKKPTKRQKPKQNTNEINYLSEKLLNTSISEPVIKKSRGRAKKAKENHVKPVKTIDSYLIKTNEAVGDSEKTVEDHLAKTTVEKLKQQSRKELNFSFDLNASKFGDEDEDLDLSGIIDNIVCSSPKIPEKVKKLGYVSRLTDLNIERNHGDYNLTNRSTDNSCFYSKNLDEIFAESIAETNNDQVDLFDKTFEPGVEETNDLNKSCFFETNYDQVDLFEKTFEKKFSESDSENSEKDSMELCDVLQKIDSGSPETVEKITNDELNDTFDEVYVPLFERIKKHSHLNTVP